MHIAISTYSSAQNYGALLQSHALATYLKTQGHNSELLFLSPFDARRLKPRKHWKDIAAALFHFAQNFRRVARYEQFIREYLPMSFPVRTDADWQRANETYDAFISGSDQVWNCLLGPNRAFFLDKVHDNKLKCSYAASFGTNHVPEQHRKAAASLISRFDHISVRESTGRDIVLDLTGRECNVCIDPVFLMEPEYWKRLAVAPKTRKPYAFVYSTESSEALNAAVRGYVQHTGNAVITTHAIPGTSCQTRKDIGPREFLGHILQADCVVSNSFHALAFAIIFGKKVCVVPHSQKSDRMACLLEEANLTECWWEEGNFHMAETNAPGKGLERLQSSIADSKAYLDKSLKQ